MFCAYNSVMLRSRRHYTLDQYFALQRSVELKLEYFEGEIYAMAGGSLAHNRIARNVLTAFSAALAGSNCEALGSDMRVATPSGLYTYPDVSIVCGGAGELTAETVTNPVVLVEVLSDSTRDYDRTDKFDLYRSIPTLRHYVLIEPLIMSVEHRQFGDDSGWTTEVISHGTIRLAAAGVEVRIDDFYVGVVQA